MYIHRKRKIAVKSGHIPLKNIHFYLCTAKCYRIDILLLYRLKQSDIMHIDFCSLRYFSSPVFRRSNAAENISRPRLESGFEVTRPPLGSICFSVFSWKEKKPRREKL